MPVNLNKCFKLFLISFLFVPQTLPGQILKGNVYNSKNEPVIAATLSLKQTNTHAITDLNGYFELKISNKLATDTLYIACLGYKAQIIPVNFIKQDTPLHIILKENSFSLEEVTVLSKTSITKEFSVKQIDKLGIYLSPFSNADPLKAITSLPYSTNTSESANIELRGSSSDFSRVYVNDVPIYKPIRNIRIDGLGNFSILNTEMLENEYVYAGNPPLKFGNSIAGLVEIKTLNSIEEEKLKLSVTLASIGAFYTKPLNRKSFFQIYGNHQFPTAYKDINSKSTAFLNDFTSTDLGINFHRDISDYFRLNLYSYLLKEKFNSEYSMLNYSGDMFSDSKRNFNILNTEFNKGIYNLKLNSGFSYTSTKFKFANYDTRQNEKQIYLSVDNKLTFLSGLSLQFGISDDYSKHTFNNTLPADFENLDPGSPVYTYDYSSSNHNIEGYTYIKAYLRKFILGIGSRKNIPVRQQDSYFSYQSSFKYNLNKKHSFLLALGKYNGYTIPGSIIYDYHKTKSKQFSFEYNFDSDNLNLNLAVYKKQEFQPVFYTETGLIAETKTDIDGLEFSIDYTVDRFKITSSYIYLDSEFDFGEGEFHSSNSMNYMIKGTIGYFNENLFNITAGLTMRPGLYFTPVTDKYFDNDINNYRPVYGEMNSRNYDPYRSVDLSLSKLFQYKKNNFVFFLTLTNILNKSNQQKIIYARDYQRDGYWKYMKRILYFGIVLEL